MSAAHPSPTPRKVALAGATGLVGRALLDELLASPEVASVLVLLRRAARDLPAHRKIEVRTVDFARLPPLPPLDDVFIALGTTIKVAGSQAAFRQVDFDAVVNTARAAHDAGASRAGIVSALGANAGSSVFYNRVKGEMQDAVAAIGFVSTVFAQPSLILGDRQALGQPPRAGEVWTARLLGPVMGLLPRAVRPIDAHDIAHALLRGTLGAAPGVHVLSSGQMQPSRRSGR